MDNIKDQTAKDTMTIPKSILYNSLKDAIVTKDDTRILELTDVLYMSMTRDVFQDRQISENSERIEEQHNEVLNAIAEMKAGFEKNDKRFDDLIHHSDKRFDSMDKRFDELIHHFDKRFESVDKRFESMDKRFESMDKRFESMDKRFDDLIHHSDKRFESMDKRFDDLLNQMNSRFESITRRSTFQSWLIGIGFVTINTLIVVLKLIR